MAPGRQPETGSSSAALLGLASLCAIAGFVPATGLRLVTPALRDLPEASTVPVDWASPLSQLQTIFLLFLALTIAVCGVKLWIQKKTGVRLRETWGCGYQAINTRMQYTASGFAEELVKLGRPVLHVTVSWEPLRSVLPFARRFHSHCHDRIEEGYLFLDRVIERLLASFRWIQSGNIRHYVLYVFAAVTFYLLCSLVW